MNNRTGLTVIELLAGMTISIIIITLSFSVTSSFLSRIRISGTVTTITTSLSRARYLALSEGRRIKFKIDNAAIYLQKFHKGEWINIRTSRLRGGVNIRANGSPVFSPLGSASPLCSIRVWNNDYLKIISLSFAGRIKIKIPVH